MCFAVCDAYQGPALFEDLGVDRHGDGRREYARAPARRLLVPHPVGSAVRAQEEVGGAAGDVLCEGGAVRLALEDGQAVVVRADAADEQRVPIEEHVLRCDGGGDLGGVAGTHELRSITRRDVLHDDAEVRVRVEHAPKDAIDEEPLTIEDVDLGIDDFAMDEEDEAGGLHRRKRVAALANVGDARSRVGRCARGVELEASDDAALLGAVNLLGRCVVREIQRHQRLERRRVRLGRRARDAALVRRGHVDRRHRRHQIRHDDRPAEVRRAPGHRVPKRIRPIAKVQVPIVRRGDADPRAERLRLGRAAARGRRCASRIGRERTPCVSLETRHRRHAQTPRDHHVRLLLSRANLLGRKPIHE